MTQGLCASGPLNQAGTGHHRSGLLRAHQAFLLPTGAGGGGEDDAPWTAVGAQGTGAVGGARRSVVQQDAGLPWRGWISRTRTQGCSCPGKV